MDVRPVEANDLAALAAMAAPLQQRPDSHVVYLGLEPDSIAAELAETTWSSASFVAVESGVPVAFLIADVDPDMGRVWWFGPFVTTDDWEPVATELLERCRGALDAGVVEEEMAFDERAEELGRWAERMGLSPDPGSLVLSLERELDPPSTIVTRPVASTDRDAVAALHERLFSGTHTTGATLVDGADDTHLRLVAERDGSLVGYVAVEQQEDGVGYIDYVGVDEASRRRGIGAELVRAGVAALWAIGAHPVHLTVRVDSDGARELYASLGFTEHRIVRPYRRGFTLP